MIASLLTLGFAAAVVRITVPYALAALGGTLSERSGVINIALEGLLLIGAFTATMGAWFGHGAVAGVLGGVAGGAAFGALYALLVVTLRGDQIVCGVALNLLADGLTRFWLKATFDSSSNSPRIDAWGSVGSRLIVLTVVLVALFHVVVYRTPFGLRLRAVGEHPKRRRSLGVRPARIRWVALHPRRCARRSRRRLARRRSAAVRRRHVERPRLHRARRHDLRWLASGARRRRLPALRLRRGAADRATRSGRQHPQLGHPDASLSSHDDHARRLHRPLARPTRARPHRGAVSTAPSAEGASVVGDYALMRRLGSGAAGEVWLGRHVVTGTPAALKLLRPRVASRERTRRTFERERRAIGRLGHPHIVALFDVGPDWLATAYVDGTDLARRLKTPIDPAMAVHLTLQIAAALGQAHAYGVVHRDVKPSNILIDVDGNAFLADFGLALLPESIDDEHRVGTPAYMAPEQARGELASPAADQYALGRTLVEMLVGARLPIDRDAALAELPAGLPPALVAAVARATSVRPTDRFPDVGELAAALSAVDLARYPPPRRLAPEVRVRAPFAWVAGAVDRQRLGPDIERADHRLGALVDAGLLSPEAVARFTAQTGYSDIGFTVWGNVGRLGPLDDPSALCRATELVVLVHGMFCSKASWWPIGPSVARDNAQALVIAVDHSGFGESRFAADRPAAEHASPRGVCTMLLACLELLGIRELPAVLVGHSFGAASLLTMRDDELGERVSRLAITPVFPAVDARYRKLLNATAGLIPTVGAFRILRKLMARMFASSARAYTRRERRLMALEFEHVRAHVVAEVARQYALSTPARGDQLQRCMVVIADDDPVAPARILMPALDELGFPRTHVRRLVATGGHFPHAEQLDRPKWTLRNVADLAACVGSMLRASAEGAPFPTEMSPTLVASLRV